MPATYVSSWHLFYSQSKVSITSLESVFPFSAASFFRAFISSGVPLIVVFSKSFIRPCAGFLFLLPFGLGIYTHPILSAKIIIKAIIIPLNTDSKVILKNAFNFVDIIAP